MSTFIHTATHDKRWMPRSLMVVALTYWVLVMGLWGMFAFDRGLTFETTFPVACQKGLYECLVYGDNLRPYNSLFLGLGHVLSFNSGSYVAYQVLYGLLWWGRGMLTFLITQLVWPSYPLAGFLFGALVLVHVSDGAVNWIGQLHQFGFMFFLALAVYLLLRSWLAEKPLSTVLFLALSLFALYISLWTYESQYFLVLSMPLLLVVLRPQFNWRLIVTTVIWYLLPAVYGWKQIERYLLTKSTNYQTSIIRPDMNAAAILHDWWINLQQSTQFWLWRAAMPVLELTPLAPTIAVIGVVGFGLGAYLLVTSTPSGYRLPSVRSLLVGLGFGILWLILSFPIYLLISGNTNAWRTQMLSGFGFAIAAGCLILLLAQVLGRGQVKPVLAVLASAVIVFYGVQGGVLSQGFHGYRWQIHRAVLSQVAQIVPDIDDQTLILLVGIPKAYAHDPFGAAMWFDSPVQLLYPGKQVVGYFIYETGELPTDTVWQFTTEGMTLQKQGFANELQQVSYGQIIALTYQPDGQVRLLEKLPSTLTPIAANVAQYAPRQRIKAAFLPEQTVRMFGR